MTMTDSSEPLLCALEQACREFPARRKVLLLSDPARGAAILERLTRRTSWANLLVQSPARYAEELAGSTLEQRAPLPPAAGPGLAAWLLSGPVKAGRLNALAASPGTAQALWRTLRDLRLAGVSSQDLEGRHFLAPKRHEEIRALLAGYERALADNGWHDEADALRAGAARADKSQDLVLVPEPQRWNALEQALIDACAHRRRAVTLHREGGLSAMPATPDAFRAVTQEAEARQIIQKVLESKTPFDRVEVALAGPAYDQTVLTELCDKLGVPFTVAGGYPVATLPAGKAVLGYLAWVESGFETGLLEKLLRSGAVSLKNAGEVSALAAARALSRYSLYKGRPAYERVLKARVQELEAAAKAAERDEDPAAAQAALQGLSGFEEVAKALRLIVEGAAWADADRIPLSDAVAGTIAFLSAFVPTRSELDGLSVSTLKDALNAAAATGDRALTRAEVCLLLRETCLAVAPGAERARPGKLHITSLDQAGWEGRPLTFVAGLTLYNHPGRVGQDPFLLDEERRRLGRALLTAEEAQSDRSRLVAGRLASLKGAAVFSAYAFDAAEGREAGPAALFLEVVRRVKSKPEAGYREIDGLIGEPVALGAAPVDELSWWLARTPLPAEVAKAFAWAADAEKAAQARADDKFGPYDGLVSAAGGDPTKKDHPISASYMADLAACPFRFFLKRVLLLRPKEDEERDPLVWLDPAERGELLHEIYAEFLRLQGDRPPDPKNGEKPLLALLDGKLEALKTLIPPATDALFEGEKKELRAEALLFLRKTAEEWALRRPVGREVSFGMTDSAGETLSSPKPVAVTLGGERFHIRGAIDRVDKVGEHDYEVLDYKTGRLTDTKIEEMEALPAGFQPAFYMKAVEELLKKDDPQAKVTAFHFLFSTRAGRWTRLAMTPAQAKEVEDSIHGLLETLRQGRFRQTEDKDTCERCPYASVCGDAPWERAKLLHGGKK